MLSSDEVDANRKAWIAALRSGEYTQIYGRFFDDAGDEAEDVTKNRNCCAVGVLFTLPECHDGFVQESLGLSLGEIGEIYEMNDDKRMTFAQIADVWESRWFPEANHGQQG